MEPLQPWNGILSNWKQCLLLLSLLANGALVRAESTTVAEVVWGIPSDAIETRLPGLPKDRAVLDRSNGQLHVRQDGKFILREPVDGELVLNVATRNFLEFRESEKQWVCIPSAGELNVRDFGARGDYVPGKNESSSDDTAAIQAAIDAAGTFGHHAIGRVVYVPAGRYRITKTLNVTTDLKENNHCNLVFQGDGVHSTYFYGNTGGILFDFTGSMWIRLEDFSINTHFGANPSTVGLYIARGQENQWAIRYRINRIGIQLQSDPSANDGVGTVGIWNFGGEHHTYNDINVEANLPVALVLWRKAPEGLPTFIESGYIKVQETNAVSQHFTTIGGTSILVAMDYVRPCLYVNRAAEVRLDNTYLSMRRNPYNPNQTKPGTCFYAVELNAVYQFYHHGMLEGAVVSLPEGKGPGYGYLRNRIYVDGADIKVGLAYALEEERATPDVRKQSVPAVDLTPCMEFASGIFNSSIDIQYQPNGNLILPEHPIVAGKNEWVDRLRVENSRVQTTSASMRAQDLLCPNVRRGANNAVLYDYLGEDEVRVPVQPSLGKTPKF